MEQAEHIFKEIERETGETILVKSGFGCIGEPDDPLYQNYASTAKESTTEFMNSKQLMQKWPHLNLPDHVVGMHDTHGGILYAKRSLEAFKKISL